MLICICLFQANQDYVHRHQQRILDDVLHPQRERQEAEGREQAEMGTGRQVKTRERESAGRHQQGNRESGPLGWEWGVTEEEWEEQKRRDGGIGEPSQPATKQYYKKEPVAKEHELKRQQEVDIRKKLIEEHAKWEREFER